MGVNEDRWWATYNAALSGVLAADHKYPDDFGAADHAASVHKTAIFIATHVHGGKPKLPEPPQYFGGSGPPAPDDHA